VGSSLGWGRRGRGRRGGLWRGGCMWGVTAGPSLLPPAPGVHVTRAAASVPGAVALMHVLICVLLCLCVCLCAAVCSSLHQLSGPSWGHSWSQSTSPCDTAGGCWRAWLVCCCCSSQPLQLPCTPMLGPRPSSLWFSCSSHTAGALVLSARVRLMADRQTELDSKV
jgi:hypothetical protein